MGDEIYSYIGDYFISQYVRIQVLTNQDVTDLFFRCFLVNGLGSHGMKITINFPTIWEKILLLFSKHRRSKFKTLENAGLGMFRLGHGQRFRYSSKS